MLKKAYASAQRMLTLVVVIVFMVTMAIIASSGTGLGGRADLATALASLSPESVVWDATGPILFDGTPSNMKTWPSRGLPHLTDERTIKVEIKPAARGSNFRDNVFLSYGEVENNEAKIFNMGLFEGDVILRVGYSAYARFDTNLSTQDGQWHDVVLVYSEDTPISEVIVYANNQRFMVSNLSNNTHQKPKAYRQGFIRLGGSVNDSVFGHNHYFNGEVRNVVIYNQAIDDGGIIVEPEEQCGDGGVGGDEQCDDGNNGNGDGCDSQCRIETGWDCEAIYPSVACAPGHQCPAPDPFTLCSPRCGDGRVVSPEDCDVVVPEPELDSDGDGVLDGQDQCPGTPPGTQVDSRGCPSGLADSDGDGVPDSIDRCPGTPLGVQVDSFGCLIVINPGPTCGNARQDSGETCDDGNARSGDGCSANCQSEQGWRCFEVELGGATPSVCNTVCGDGLRVGGEACDDGNRTLNDGCTATCGLEPGWQCGDGIQVPAAGEECDDGNVVSGDRCSSDCKIESSGPPPQSSLCGDGIKGPYEGCDDQNGNNGDGCAVNCRVETGWSCVGSPSLCTATCGDGVVKGNETCDDGNLVDGDGCNSSCLVEQCGDGIPQASLGEQCDDGNIVDGDGCTFDCVLEYCGDGIHQPFIGEICDDGNLIDGDGCNAQCGSEACGNGLLDFGEACDDGNAVDGDGCSALCLQESCGDGALQFNLGEQCDDGNNLSFDGCSSNCVVERCGDGQVQPPEECDDANFFTNDGCNSQCMLERCGDGILQPTLNEQCDDGNAVAGDGCSPLCTQEFCGDGLFQPTLGEACDDGNTDDTDSCDNSCQRTVQTPAVPVCGDGVAEGTEACDDGNTTAGDGCFRCALEGCGNGQLDSGEECDDGNNSSYDGCSATCQQEVCGDGIRHQNLNEECDDGNRSGGDGCDSNCYRETAASPGPSVCGNGVPEAGEDCNNCPADIPGCLVEDPEPENLCGNGRIDFGENCSSCPQDIASCPPPITIEFCTDHSDCSTGFYCNRNQCIRSGFGF